MGLLEKHERRVHHKWCQTHVPTLRRSRLRLELQLSPLRHLLMLNIRNTLSIGTVCMSDEEMAHFALNKLTERAGKTA